MVAETVPHIAGLSDWDALIALAAYDSALAEGIRAEWRELQRWRREARRPKSGPRMLRARDRRAAKRAAERHRAALLALLAVRKEVREATR